MPFSAAPGLLKGALMGFLTLCRAVGQTARHPWALTRHHDPGVPVTGQELRAGRASLAKRFDVDYTGACSIVP